MQHGLSSLRVLDFSSGIAGAYGAKLLADAGADVVKVEPPAGDPWRSWSAGGATPGGSAGAAAVPAVSMPVVRVLGVEGAVGAAFVVVSIPPTTLGTSRQVAHLPMARS